MGDIVHEVEELAADGVREITRPRPERQLLRARPRRRAVPAAVRRPAPRARRGRRHRSHPLHVTAPEGPAPRDHRGDGGVPLGVRAPAPAVAVGERPHAGAHAPRLHRRALPASASPPPAPPSPDLAVTTDIIVGFPGETDDDFVRTLEVVDEAAYDAAYTFVFSPRPGTAAGRHGRRLRRPRRRAGADAAAHRGGRAPRAGEARGPRRRASSRCWSRARRRTTTPMWSGRTRQNKLVHFCPPGADRRARVGGTADVVVTYAAPHWLRGDLVERSTPAPRPARIRIPVAAAPA